MAVPSAAPAGPAATPGFLREQRLRRSLSPVDLAEQVGVHPTSVLRWERGERLPGPVHLTGLARALGVETARVAAFFDARRLPSTSPGGVRGHGLRLLRDHARLPVAKVARTVGVPPATVYNWEAGRARLPLEHLPALAHAFRLDAEALRELLVRAPAVTQRPLVSPLRRIRRRSALSQGAVAARIGVSRHLVSRWELGERPPLVAVRRLAHVYGVPVSTVARAAGVQAPELLDPRRWNSGDLPEVLRVLRQWSGLTQREVAVHCACSIAAVRSWERGRSVPRPARLRRLADVFGLGPEALVRALPQ